MKRLRRHGFLLAMVASIGVHAAAAAALMRAAPTQLGAVAIETRAISVSLAVTDILESTEPLDAVASEAAAQEAPLGDAAPKPAPKSEPETALLAPPPPPKPVMEPKTERSPQKAERRPLKEREKAEKRAKPQPRRAGKTQGAASTGRSARNSATSGQVSASQGAVQTYASLVRARLAARKPASRGEGGRVVIRFSLSAGGQVLSAAIARSSGNPSLDQAALAAVRSAGPFPPPPAGTSASNLRFSIPYQFR